MRRLMLVLVVAIDVAAHRRRPLAAKLNADGRTQEIQEYMFPREWMFQQEFDVPGRERWRRTGSVRVSLDRTRIAKFHNSNLQGIWNHKPVGQPYLEIELPLNKQESEYLVYKIKVKQGKFFSNAIHFYDGNIFKISSVIPTKETVDRIGSFKVTPVVPRPMIDRSLKC